MVGEKDESLNLGRDLGSIAPTRQRLLRLLEAMADADATFGHLEMLAPDERHQVLVEWNLTQTDYPTGRFIDELFARQAERTPERTAAVFENQRLSYAELKRRADGLADRLHALGVGPDVLVALFLERSLEMVVGVLGVLRPEAPMFRAIRHIRATGSPTCGRTRSRRCC